MGVNSDNLNVPTCCIRDITDGQKLKQCLNLQLLKEKKQKNHTLQKVICSKVLFVFDCELKL